MKLYRITIIKQIPEVNGSPSGFVELETVFKATRISISQYKAKKIKAHYEALGYVCRCEIERNYRYPFQVNYKLQGLETEWNYCDYNYRIQAIQTFKKLLKRSAIASVWIDVYKNGSYVRLKQWGDV